MFCKLVKSLINGQPSFLCQMHAVFKEIFRVFFTGEIGYDGTVEFGGQIPDVLIVILTGFPGEFREVIPVTVDREDDDHRGDGQIPADGEEDPQVVVLRGVAVTCDGVCVCPFSPACGG